MVNPIFLTVVLVHSVVIYKTTHSETLAELEIEAENIRGVLMATRRIYHNQFLESGLPVNDKTVGFLPAHAMGLISKDFRNWVESGLTFNNVSDRARNPDNAADEIELEAMDYFRSNPEEKNRFRFIEQEDPIYHYTEPIWIEEYCLKCHGSKEDAPESISRKYSESYGYELGDLRGLMSIKMPVGHARERARAAVLDNLTFSVIGYASIFFAMYMLIERFSIRPLRTLIQGSQELASGQYGWRSGIQGQNEVEQLAGVFDTMAERIEDHQTEMRESEMMYHGLTETAADAIVSCDSEGQIIAWNNAAEHIFGYTEAEAKTINVDVLIPEELEGKHDKKFNVAVLTKGGSFRNGRTIEGNSVRKDGTEFPAAVSISIWVSERESFFTAIIRDVSESKKLEEQLFQSQKMEAIGQLAGGVAHDFNNLLQVIDGYAQLAQIASERGMPLTDELTQIREASEKSAILIRQLLTFSRRQVMELSVVNISDVVELMLQMIKRIIGEHIIFHIECDDDLPSVRVDRGMLEQIIVNLCVNARDAMPDGGTLTIVTTKASLDVEDIESESEESAQDYIVLRVEDTGEGMNADTLEHIFEPFFTTKEPGKGTGLGLSTLYGAVKQHNGEVKVDSEVGVGTKFSIYFPSDPDLEPDFTVDQVF